MYTAVSFIAIIAIISSELYSWRKAHIGSILDARNTGDRAASTEISDKKKTIRRNDAGSEGLKVRDQERRQRFGCEPGHGYPGGYAHGGQGEALGEDHSNHISRSSARRELQAYFARSPSSGEKHHVTTLQDGLIHRMDLKAGLMTVLHTQEPVGTPTSLTIDADGNLIVAAGVECRVRLVNLADGSVRTIAGNGLIENGRCASSGDNGPAAEASFEPDFVAKDPNGNLFIADMMHGRIRRVDAKSGIITMVAGSDLADTDRDGKPATETRLGDPTSVAVSRTGDLFISQLGKGPRSHPIRRLDFQTGFITTLSGASFASKTPLWAELTEPRLLFIDPLGNLYALGQSRVHYLDFSRHLISVIAGSSKGFGGDGGPAKKASLNYPSGLAQDSQGNLYIADLFNNRIRRVDARTRIITTIAGNGLPPGKGSTFRLTLSLKALRSSTTVRRFGR
jgi:sugar lactone lactonase YvrE